MATTKPTNQKKTTPKKKITPAEARRKGQAAAIKARQRAAVAAKVASKRTRLDGFIDFVRSHGVVGLAIGIVIGTQVKQLTDQLVASFISPLLGLILPGTGSLAEKTFTVTMGDNTQVFAYGAFAAVMISFLAVAAVIYYIIKGLKLDKLDKKKD